MRSFQAEIRRSFSADYRFWGLNAALIIFTSSALGDLAVKTRRIKRGSTLIMAAPRGAIGNHLFNINRLRFDQRPLLSPKPDEDLTVIRAAASKVILAGRGQAARDLAEFAITIAGDRPERHSRALLTIADIYARLGMKTEALVALAAMLEISGDATWDQIWFESNLLFSMLRDAGMSHFGLPVLERSKEALCKADCCARECGCHCSRLANLFS